MDGNAGGAARSWNAMSRFDLEKALPIARAADFDGWLRAHGASEREVVAAIHNRRSLHQTVTLVELQEVALCHGWVDTQTRRIDDSRYAIRFVPRRPGSNWSPKNRAMAERMLAAGRVTRVGRATLPPDLMRDREP
jgi:uncharacterized protein YdeI (YjbR/CyaY-like superfamily)